MTKKLGNKLYAMRCLVDGETVIVDGYQIEAIRYSEREWYKGEHCIEILRECTQEDLKEYPLATTRRTL